MKMTQQRLRAEVNKIKWFHTIDLGNDIITPGADNTLEKQKIIKMPQDLTGMTVLDVGAWDGFFSFEAEKRGATKVLATDYYCWGGGGWGTQDGFNLARNALNSNVEDKKIDVLDLSMEAVGLFDVVLFLGVLYHMKHPILALEKISSITGKQLILETHVDLLEIEKPAAAVYPADELNHDNSNWWGFNPSAIKGLLHTVGFNRVEIASGPNDHPLFKNRMVFHAWK